MTYVKKSSMVGRIILTNLSETPYIPITELFRGQIAKTTSSVDAVLKLKTGATLEVTVPAQKLECSSPGKKLLII